MALTTPVKPTPIFEKEQINTIDALFPSNIKAIICPLRKDNKYTGDFQPMIKT